MQIFSYVNVKLFKFCGNMFKERQFEFNDMIVYAKVIGMFSFCPKTCKKYAG